MPVYTAISYQEQYVNMAGKFWFETKS